MLHSAVARATRGRASVGVLFPAGISGPNGSSACFSWSSPRGRCGR